MPWLSLKRLLPSRKMWKLLKTKLPLKLQKLNRSKANKKPLYQSHKTSKKFGWPSSLSVQPKNFKTRPKFHHHKKRHHYLQTRPPPVFVDQLFIEPVSIAKECVRPLDIASQGEASKDNKQGSGISDQRSKEGESSDHKVASADDMWESMVIASPLMMDGINQRAEEFIARMRAQMHHQEMLARRL